jgi:hypothetical protein
MDGSEVATLIKHYLHVEDVGSVETAQVKAGEAGASIEHASHTEDIGSVETAQVQAAEAGAVQEHASHVVDVDRVEIFHSRDGGKVFHTIEPKVAGSGMSIGKRGIKDYMGDTGIGLIS